MCKIKEGIAVKTTGDLQNLVTSVILRQTSTFSVEDICEATRKKLSGSSYDNESDIKKRCAETISTLYLIDCLRDVGNGRYSLAISFPSVNNLRVTKT